MDTARKIAEDVHVLPSYFPLPGFGMVPVNAFVLTGEQPMLIDTGLMPETDDFVEQLGTVIDPADLRWLWITHTDPDHMGSMHRLLEAYPNITLVTAFMNFGALGLTGGVDPTRVRLVNQGETFDIGDRTLTALRPPTFDNPGTTGLFDRKSGALFSSDCFGALVQQPAEVADEISADDLRAGQTLWTTIDSPWVHGVDRSHFAANVKAIRDLEPSVVLSSHLPPALRITDVLTENLLGVPDAEAFVAPDQSALEAMLAEMTEPTPA